MLSLTVITFAPVKIIDNCTSAVLSIVIQRVGTKLPEIFDLKYEYLFRRQFSRVSEANK
jgi:hypothetical protein